MNIDLKSYYHTSSKYAYDSPEAHVKREFKLCDEAWIMIMDDNHGSSIICYFNYVILLYVLNVIERHISF